MQINRAGESDLTALLPLFDAYRAYFTGTPPQGSGEFLRERLRSQDSVIFLARLGPDAVGFVQLYPLFSSWHVQSIWFLSDLFVAPTARRQGVAQSLLARVQAFQAESAARSVMVELPRREPHLFALYEQAGYRRDPDFELYRLFAASVD